MSLIVLRNIFKSYKADDRCCSVISDLSMDIERGSFSALLGRSGSGKSSLLNIIGLLDDFDSGSYTFDGIRMSGVPEKDLAGLRNREIGFVFQAFNLIQTKNIWENVALPLYYAGVKVKQRRDRAYEVLNAVGLKDKAEFKPRQLSGGQSQRAAIARALISSPSIILADEPTGALDVQTGLEIMHLFNELNGRGTTIFMITHDHSVASCADHIYYLRDGSIVDQTALYAI